MPPSESARRPLPVALTVQANPRQISRGALVDRAGLDPRVLRRPDRRSAVSELHARRHRKRSARRTQPGLLRDPESAAAALAAGVAERSRGLRGLPAVLPGARNRAPVVGTGVGWKNYHEQWLSEGFAQYFAALYAERDRGDEVFRGMLRQMRRWAIEQSDQGPVYLGYRLGHIKGEGRVFRALVYNKGAMVLHMLRRARRRRQVLRGPPAVLRHRKFRKAGTDDFRRAMEKVSGQDLTSFFDGWIYGSAVPRSGSAFDARVGRGASPVRASRNRDPDPGDGLDRLCRRADRGRDRRGQRRRRRTDRAPEGPGAVDRSQRDDSAVAEIGR